MMDRTIRRIFGFFIVICAVLATVAVRSVNNINRSAESSDWVNHTHAVMLDVKDVLADVTTADGAALSYAASKDPRFKAACRDSLGDLAEHLAVAKALTRHEPAQYSLAVHLDDLANARADFDRDILHAAKPEAVTALVAASAGATANIRAAVDTFINEESDLLVARDQASFVQARAMRRTVWAGGAIDLLLLAGVAWLIWDDIKARRAAAAALEEANRQLETKVQERTAELAAANRQLTADNFERKWANQALEHQLRYNQLIINSIADAVFVLTKAVNISRINPAVAQLTGMEAPELVNKPFSSVVRLEEGGGDSPLTDPIIRALNDGRDLREQPALIQDKRGRQVRGRLSVYPLRDHDKVVGGVAIIQIAQ